MLPAALALLLAASHALVAPARAPDGAPASTAPATGAATAAVSSNAEGAAPTPSAARAGGAAPATGAATAAISSNAEGTAPAPSAANADGAAPAPSAANADGAAPAPSAANAHGAATATDPHQAAVQAAQAAQRAAQAAEASAKVLADMAATGTLPGDDTPALKPLSPWTLSLTLNAMAVSGNANARSGKITAGAEGHWRLWSLELRLGGSYGETYPNNQQGDLTALNANFQARGERMYTAALGTYLLGGAATDHVASIAYQAYGEGGVSLVWWEATRADFVRSRLRTSVGFRVTRESRYQFIPVRQAVPNPLRTLLSPTISANFRFGFNRGAYFTEDLDLQQDIGAPRDLRLRSATGLTAQIMQNVALSLTYTVRRVGAPAPGKEPTDTELASGITWSY